MEVYHILPVNDLKPHLDTSKIGNKSVIEGEVRDVVYSMCECKPVVEYLENDHVIIVHNSFDGREGVEWMNEILNTQ